MGTIHGGAPQFLASAKTGAGVNERSGARRRQSAQG